MQKRQFLTVTLILVLSLVLAVIVIQSQEDETQLLSDFEVETLFIGKDVDGLDIGFVSWGDSPDNVVLELVQAEGDLALPEQDDDNTILSVSYDITTF